MTLTTTVYDEKKKQKMRNRNDENKQQQTKFSEKKKEKKSISALSQSHQPLQAFFFLSFHASHHFFPVIYIRELRCLRNTIHANLFLTHILSGLLWILTLSLQASNQMN